MEDPGTRQHGEGDNAGEDIVQGDKIVNPEPPTPETDDVPDADGAGEE